MNGNIAAGRLLCKKKPRERPDFSYSLLSGKLNHSRVNLNKVFGLRSLLGRMKKTSHYKWWAVVSIATGTLVTVADIGEVNVAMPTIADEFSSNLSTVQWLATGYLVATSALLMPMGRLSDMIGRKRVYLWGLLIFTLGSGLAGIAPNLPALIMFRILQGMGIGLVHGNQMAIMASIFPAEERGKALGLHMTLVGTALIIGPAIGGVFVDTFGWRSVFFLNVPLGILCTLAPFLILNEKEIMQSGPRARFGEFDWLGSFLSSGVLVLLVLGLTNPFDWAVEYSMAILASCAGLLATFILWETKTSTPVLDMALFKTSIFSLGVSARSISFVAAASILFLMPFYFQGVKGYSPSQTGLIMTSIAFGMVIVAPIAGRLSDRYGSRPFTVAGALISVSGLLILSRITADTPLSMIMLGILLQSSGMGMFTAPNASSILSGVSRRSYGVVSGFVQLIRTGSTVTGIAIATLVIIATMSALGLEATLEGFAAGVSPEIGNAFTAGLRRVYLIMAGLQVLVAILSLIRGRVATRQELEEDSPTASGNA